MIFASLFRGGVAATLLAFTLAGCGGNPSGNASANADTTPSASPTTSASASTGLPDVTPQYTYKVVATYPHDTASFTEGLYLQDGVLYESTGLNGKSKLRIEDLATGKVSKEVGLDDQYFGEGITDWKGKIYRLTWKGQVGFTYDSKTLTQNGKFDYSGEGWALTHDDQYLIMDDGSDKITFRDPVTFGVVRTIHVADHGNAVDQLNELEYIKGEIWANVWQTNYIVRIDPQTGAVKGWIDLAGIETGVTDTNAVLNGIAYDAAADKVYITGKLWPHIFQITLAPKS